MRRGREHVASKPAVQSAGKHLIKQKDLEERLYKQAMKVGWALERRRRFAEAASVFQKAFRVYPLGPQGAKAKKALDRADAKAVRLAGKRAPVRWGTKVNITAVALEAKLLRDGFLTAQEALWYSVLSNETVIGNPPRQQRDAATLRQTMTRWLPPRLRRPTSSSASDTYKRPTHVAANMAAAAAQAASTVKLAVGALPRMVRDGRAWAFARKQAGGGEGARPPKFYLPPDNWPARGPCLFCFTLAHPTKAHGRAANCTRFGAAAAAQPSRTPTSAAAQGKVIGVGDAPLLDETEEDETEEGGGDEEETDGGADPDPHETARRALFRTYRHHNRGPSLCVSLPVSLPPTPYPPLPLSLGGACVYYLVVFRSTDRIRRCAPVTTLPAI